MKIFMFFINLIFWMWAFIVPAGIFAFFAYFIYLKSASNRPFTIIICVIGVILGIWVAETIRKKYGLSHFFSRIMASPDLDPESKTEDK